MDPLLGRLIERIRATGPISFADYMRVALYDPDDGYYAGAEARTGRRGDYMTSPELDPAFAGLWSRGIEQVWDACGRPDRFDVVELGPGEGAWAAGLLDVVAGDFARALHLTLVDPAPTARARAAKGLQDPSVRWASGLDEVDPFDAGCVFANEVLDNQPIHVLRTRDGLVEELHVDLRDDALVETWPPCSDPRLAARCRDLSGDGRRDISPEAEALAAQSLGLIERGACIFIDYGSDGPATDSVVAYSGSGVGAPRLDRPGREDITGHVDWRAVTEACAAAGGVPSPPVPQRDVLLSLGAEAHDGSLKDEHAAALARGEGAGAVRALSRRQSLRALLDPGGLGGLDVFVALKGIDPPGFLKRKDRPEGRS